MDMSNKQLKVTYTQTTSYPPGTVATCEVLLVLADGVRQVVGTYELTFGDIYGGPSDPALIAAITEKLAAV